MNAPHTLSPTVGTAEGLPIVPISTLPPAAGVSPDEQKRAKKKARDAAYHLANRERIRVQRADYRAKNKDLIRVKKAVYVAANREKVRAYKAAHHLANRDRHREKSAAYAQKNKESQALKKAAYAQANREKIRVYQAAYRKDNREKMSALDKTYRAKNSEQLRIRSADYRAKNIQKIATYLAEYQKARLKADPLFRLASSLRCRMRLAFKSQRAEKTRATLDLVGCTKEELRQHLASQFRDGMTLENHGKVWHIDHIRPCASFDLSDPNQVTLCFHYSNLQPLFAGENLRKKDRWEPTELRPLAA